MADISKITPLGSSTTYDLKDSRSLWRSGGTMTGTLTTHGLKGTLDIDYGETLPQTGSEGQIFFQLSDPYYELPTGGTTGQVLVKNSNNDRDVGWSSTSQNAIALKDRTNNTLTYSNYGAAGLAASAVTWLTCWNGYELRAISKAEMANSVDSSHKWVRLAGDTMTGKLSIVNNSTGANPNSSNIELREYNTLSNTGTHSAAYAPRLGFHWGNRYWCQFALFDSRLRLYNGDLSGYFPFQASAVYGAVWNDYAEMRNVPEANIFEETENNRNIKLAGRCVRDVGDGTMVQSTTRLERGCKIISDTFGFNIGETNNCKTPIAVSGRVLVYPYESIEEFSTHIGWPVCSGPNGTVSIMTEEEEEKYPSRIIGTISEIPKYKIWGENNIDVKGRIWIYVK